MATFVKRNNSWRFQISYYSADGKRHYINRQGYKTKHEAQMAARELESAQDKGLSMKTSDEPLKIYFEKWFKLYVEPGAKYNTLHHYQVTLNILKKDELGNYALDAITPAIYQDFINRYGANHAKWTIKKINAQIRACIKKAVYDGNLHRDFTQEVKLIYDKSRTREVVWLDAEQTKTVIADINQSLISSKRSVSRYMVLTDLLTGLRIGELMALTWEDVDFDKQTISVNKSWDYVNNVSTTTKTQSSNRVIPINSTLSDQLQHLHEFQEQHNNVRQGTHIFLNNNHCISSVSAFNKQVRNILKECNIDIPDFHFHSLRHSHASFLLYKGVSVFAISQRLGHSNTQITMSVYSHVIAEMKNQEQDKTIAALDDLNG